MFNESKYTTWYCSIIANALNTNKEGYTERHHIIPKSLGGDDSNANLVRLSAREHFVVHWLLTKMVQGEDARKMKYAFKLMAKHGKSSRVSGIARETTAKHSAETKAKIGQSQIGRVQSEEAKQKMRDHWAVALADGDKRYHPKMRTESREKMRKRKIEMFSNMTATQKAQWNVSVRLQTQVEWTCPHCGVHGRGTSNFTRWHGDNCYKVLEEQDYA